MPDDLFEQLFNRLTCDRDRALVAMFLSTAARAAELLGVPRGRLDIGNQLIGVIRKGSGALQWLPASPDAFVWLRLYQRSMRGKVPSGPGAAVWWTLRPVGAGNPVRAGQAACLYSWRMPARRSCRQIRRRVSVAGSVIVSGSGCSGRAFAMPR